MKDDVLYKGFIAGFIGTFGDVIVQSVSHLILKTTTTAQYIAKLAFPQGNMTFAKVAIGFWAHLIAGAFVGIVLALIFKHYGKEHPYSKGLGIGFAMWIIHVIVIPNIITTPRPLVFRTELESIVDLTAHSAFGLFTAWIILKMKVQSDGSK